MTDTITRTYWGVMRNDDPDSPLDNGVWTTEAGARDELRDCDHDEPCKLVRLDVEITVMDAARRDASGGETQS